MREKEAKEFYDRCKDKDIKVLWKMYKTRSSTKPRTGKLAYTGKAELQRMVLTKILRERGEL